MKKKGIIIGSLLVLTLLFTGCGKKDDTTQKTLKCTMDETVMEGVKLESEYNVKYTGKYVDLVETTEKVIADDKNKDILETYKETVESMYEPYKDIKYYDYDIVIADNTLTSTVKIDYSKIDLDKMVEANAATKSLITDNKVELKTIQDIYEQMGAKCK